MGSRPTADRRGAVRPDRKISFSHKDEGEVVVRIFDGDDGPDRVVANRERDWELQIEEGWAIVDVAFPSDIPPWLEAVARRLGLQGVRTA